MHYREYLLLLEVRIGDKRRARAIRRSLVASSHSRKSICRGEKRPGEWQRERREKINGNRLQGAVNTEREVISGVPRAFLAFNNREKMQYANDFSVVLTVFLSCFMSFAENSVKISRKAKFAGGSWGSTATLTAVRFTANIWPERWLVAIYIIPYDLHNDNYKWHLAGNIWITTIWVTSWSHQYDNIRDRKEEIRDEIKITVIST